MTMLVRDILNLGCTRLQDAGIMDPKIDAERLFCYMRNIDTGRLFMEWPAVLEEELCERYFELLDIRSGGMPLQYILGTQDFMGFTFKVNPHVLIPRQDTETLVEEAIGIVSGERQAYGISKRKSWKVLDLCCGSGAIGVSMAKKCENVEVTCSDVSKDACQVAKDNSAALGTAKKVNVVNSDLFASFKKRIGKVSFDMILSNPPYIPSGVIPGLQVEVKAFEPMMALDGGVDGLSFYRRIAAEAREHLKKNGVLIMEIGHDQADAVVDIIDKCGGYKDVKVLKDLTGKDRIVIAMN